MSMLRNRHQESQITAKRLILVSIGFVLLYLVLMCRLYHLQVTHHHHYQTLANKNKSREVSLAPYRADIIDRNQIPLAHYETQYSAKLEDLDSNTIKRLKNLGISATSNTTIEINQAQYAYLHNHKMKGVSISANPCRRYPFGAAMAHIIGYTGRLDKQHQFEAPPVEGKSGIELLYDRTLLGVVGLEKQYVNAKGQLFQSDIVVKPERSPPLQLTLDSQLQDFIYHLMLGHAGAVVVLNPQNGELLAGVSSPSFDPNLVNTKVFQERLKLQEKPMFNRLTQGLYSPGSIIKPFIALQALEEGVIEIDQTIEDPGFFKFNEHSKVFHDHKRNGHGVVNLHKAIVVSCDTYFYHLSNKLGINTLVRYLETFQFGKKTNMGFGNESKGIIPTHAYRNEHYKKWYAGQTIITGIGQGDLLVSPLQMARATMLLANDGYDYPLHYITEDVSDTEQTLHFQPRNRQHIIRAMEEVILCGTARKIGKKPYSIAGKTGTVQVVEFENQAMYQKLPDYHKDHHIFIGFAPSQQANIVVAVVIEHQHEATTIAEQIFDWCYENGYILEALDNNQ